MVQLTEVVDEHFQEGQPGPEEDEEDFTDTGMSTVIVSPFTLSHCDNLRRLP